MDLTPRDILIVCTLGGIALAGWNLYFHSKISSLRALWAWKDQFIKDYHADKIAVVEKYATKSEVAGAVEKLDEHIRELGQKFDRMRDKLESNKKRDSDRG